MPLALKPAVTMIGWRRRGLIMQASALHHDSQYPAPYAPPEVAPGELSLHELIEIVASIVPEAEVASTVRALFDRGRVSFARLLCADERAALREDSDLRTRRRAEH
jgi:hypothetical protein